MEPITASDDEIEHALAEAELPPLLPALAYVTGDLSLLRDELRPDPMLFALPQGGLNEEQQATVRGLALATLMRFRDGGCSPGAATRPTPSCCGSWSSPSAAPTWPSTCRCSRRSSRSAARTAAAPSWHKARRRARRRRSASSSSAPACRACSPRTGSQQAGVDVRRPREERRRRRHLVREHAIRAAGSTTRTTTTATRSRSATTGRSTSRPRTCCSTTSGAAPTTFGLRDHIRFGTEVLSATWSDDDARWTVAGPRRATAAEESIEANAVISAVGQLNRPSLPDIDGRESFAGPVVPLGAVGPLASTSRGKRVAVIGTGASAVQFIPEIAGAVGELAGVPAHAAVARADARVPRRGARRDCAGSTRTCRRTASGTASGSSGGWATARSQACGSIPTWESDERRRSARSTTSIAHDAHRVPRRRSSPTAPTCSPKVVPDYPAGRQADAARQRRVGRRAQARQRRAGHRAASARSPRRASSPPTATSTRSTSSSTAPASRRRSSSRR